MSYNYTNGQLIGIPHHGIYPPVKLSENRNLQRTRHVFPLTAEFCPSTKGTNVTVINDRYEEYTTGERVSADNLH